MSFDFLSASPPRSIARKTSFWGAMRTAFQSTLPLPTPSFSVPNRFTSPWKAVDEFLLVVFALRRVRTSASRTEGTSPQPETSRDGGGMVAGRVAGLP